MHKFDKRQQATDSGYYFHRLREILGSVKEREQLLTTLIHKHS